MPKRKKLGVKPPSPMQVAIALQKKQREDSGLAPLKSKNPRLRVGRGSGKAERTKLWQEKFIRVLRSSHNIGTSVTKAGITRSYAYACKAADPVFRQRWIDAWEKGIDELEAEAHRRAMEGSDLMLIFMLKGNRGSKYREKVNLENSDGTPVQFTLNITNANAPEQLSDRNDPDVYEPEFSRVPIEDHEAEVEEEEALA